MQTPPEAARRLRSAATVTASPSESPPAPLTSLRLTPVRNSTRRCSRLVVDIAGGGFRWRSEATSTALLNSARIASPAVLRMRPRCSCTSFSKTTLCPRNVCSVFLVFRRAGPAVRLRPRQGSSRLRSRPSAQCRCQPSAPRSRPTGRDHNTRREPSYAAARLPAGRKCCPGWAGPATLANPREIGTSFVQPWPSIPQHHRARVQRRRGARKWVVATGAAIVEPRPAGEMRGLCMGQTVAVLSLYWLF